jgi:hypothetical protein
VDGRDVRLRVYRSMMKRLLAVLVVGYVGVALLTKAWEATGRLSCGCDADCWCQRRELRLFRWMLPYRHRSEAAIEWKRLHAR